MGPSFRDVLQVARLHTGMATAAVPAMGALVSGAGPIAILSVALAALCHHAWGFSLNEVMDYGIDRRATQLSGKPLVSGRVTRRLALAVSFLSLILSFILMAASAMIEGEGLLWPMALLGMATLSGALYDTFGKKLTLSDVLVALWMALLVLAGASTAGGAPSDAPVIALALLSSLHILFNNSVEGGLKDVENDRECGVPTLAVVSGNSFKDGRLRVSMPFRAWGLLLRAAYIILASIFAYQLAEENGWGVWLSVIVSVGGIVLFAHAADMLRGRTDLDRKALLRQFALHEVGSFALSLAVIAPAAGIAPVLIALLLPVLWFAGLNRLLFRETLAPRV